VRKFAVRLTANLRTHIYYIFNIKPIDYIELKTGLQRLYQKLIINILMDASLWATVPFLLAAASSARFSSGKAGGFALQS
jgi:hypothetical protein